MNRLNMTELGLMMCSAGIVFLHPKDIKNIDEKSDEIKEAAEKCHIYLIATRPKISFVPGSIGWKNGMTYGRFRYAENGINKECNFQMEGEPAFDEIRITDFPHNKIELIKDEETIYTIPAYMLVQMCSSLEEPSLTDLYVEYVGMAYGDGGRSAKDRLQSHSTLQKVLADVSYDTPNLDAFILMFEYVSPSALITIDGRSNTLDPTEDRDPVADLNRMSEEISEKLRICLVEAGLIRYFRPKYNEIYKETFPDVEHKILKELYDIDISALTVEINTEDINSALYSDKRNTGLHHIANFDLHDKTIRESFFNFVGDPDGPDANDMSGPLGG